MPDLCEIISWNLVISRISFFNWESLHPMLPISNIKFTYCRSIWNHRWSIASKKYNLVEFESNIRNHRIQLNCFTENFWRRFSGLFQNQICCLQRGLDDCSYKRKNTTKMIRWQDELQWLGCSATSRGIPPKWRGSLNQLTCGPDPRISQFKVRNHISMNFLKQLMWKTGTLIITS